MTELEELRMAYAECSRQRNELLAKHKERALQDNDFTGQVPASASSGGQTSDLPTPDPVNLVDMEPVNEDLATDIDCIELRHRGDPSYEHDGFYIRTAAANKVRKSYAIYADAQLQQAVAQEREKWQSKYNAALANWNVNMELVAKMRPVLHQAREAMAPISAFGRVGSKDIEQATAQAAIAAIDKVLGT